MTADSARDAIASNPSHARHLLDGLIQQTQDAVADARRLGDDSSSARRLSATTSPMSSQSYRSPTEPRPSSALTRLGSVEASPDSLHRAGAKGSSSWRSGCPRGETVVDVPAPPYPFRP
jgi:hypothetical protein